MARSCSLPRSQLISKRILFMSYCLSTVDRIFSSTITGSAVCLFMLDQQFYHVFTGPSLKMSRTNDIDDLITHCSTTIPSTIDRDTVETEQQFLPYLSQPILVESMSKHRFTALNVIEYRTDTYCLLIGTSSTKSMNQHVNDMFNII
jgi:hypothetical protein